MVIPKKVARFNRVATNKVLGPISRRVPGFGTVVHRGRRSGKIYRTPLNVFRVPEGYVVALTYGPDSDWVRNVLAAGGCELETLGRVVTLTNPRVVHDENRAALPFPTRRFLGLIGVADLLYLDRAA
ncbi:nitroreductase family deazaflavin-dependent oxidoreductase [Amycolatopsis sp. K13G38]|uniref:Nitroreductase family deazaflavin-dependent oxidoreductase n=1 Tax=Amycolatopsis acididurans TaxID=2724524 RepID=A0ABX1JBK7_9PSEU|nr:nitroreductase family deazaflavin-dependent oxidoreductase [Amycolatopsis acididurans]NKQ57182.1 nitroreductase family deazaflavin-dependent oxidoreductase [Amycolatopsis acididurans]